MKPLARISVNGAPVHDVFFARLLGVTIVDREGVTADTISCSLTDGAPFARIPRKGDTIDAWLGYEETGVAPFGSFTCEDPEVSCLPYGMTINGRGASMRAELKQKKSRHWDGKSVKDIVSEIAGEVGLSPMIAGAVGDHKYEYLAQLDESAIHFVERLARRHGALFTVKDGNLIFAQKGAGLSISGGGLTGVTATPDIIRTGSCRTVFAHRNKVKSVKAFVQDRDKAKRVEVEEQSDPEGETDHVLPEPFADENEAKAAAKSKADELRSETMRTSVTLVGNPAIRAGAPFSYAGVRPELDGIEFIIETATHRYTKAGYETDIEAKLKVG